MPFLVFWWDHLRSTSGIICGSGSFPVRGSFAVKDRLRRCTECLSGRRGDLMVSALDSGARRPGPSPGWGYCVVFLGKTFNSHSASLLPGV